MPLNYFEYLNQQIGVSRETYDRLSIYHELLLKWQGKINLISDDTVSDAWTRHFLDSLQLLKYLPTERKRIVDLGSGSGFPGMVTSLVTDHEVHLVESDVRKCVFLKEVARLTDAKAIVHQKRIEQTPVSDVDIILSRACADLTKLLSWSSSYVSHETICLFHKGKNYAKEIEDAKAAWQFDHEVFPSITDAHSAIVRISHIK